MTPEQMDQIVNHHFMLEATDDVEGVLSTLTDDVVHHAIGSPLGEVRGREAVRPFYEGLFADIKGESAEPVGRWYGQDFVVDQTLWTGHIADGRFLGLPGREGRCTFRVLHLFELRDGLISRENVWADTAEILRQTPAAS